MSYRKISELYDISTRLKVTTEKADRLLIRYFKNDSHKTAVELNSTAHQFHGTNCSVDTTKHRLSQNNQ